ncbi:MAG: CsgG/HfaB family protein [Planctomycetota bacterium]
MMRCKRNSVEASPEGLRLLMASCFAFVGCIAFPLNAAVKPDSNQPLSLAVLPFDTQGDKEAALLISQLLTAELSTSVDLMLVEREELDHVFEEMKLTLSGLVKQSDAIQIGQLTGAQILVTGSMLDVGAKRYLIAKLISTETSRVLGVSVKGKADDDSDLLIEQLATEVRATLAAKAETLLPELLDRDERIAKLAKKLKKQGWRKKTMPSFFIDVSEEHVGEQAKDPAVRSEIEFLLTELGFSVRDEDSKQKADYRIVGEGLSEFAGRHHDLLSVKGRIELKILRKDKIVVADRQAAMAVGLNEQIAGKEALQSATASLVERLLLKLPRN